MKHDERKKQLHLLNHKKSSFFWRNQESEFVCFLDYLCVHFIHSHIMHSLIHWIFHSMHGSWRMLAPSAYLSSPCMRFWEGSWLLSWKLQFSLCCFAAIKCGVTGLVNSGFFFSSLPGAEVTDQTQSCMALVGMKNMVKRDKNWKKKKIIISTQMMTSYTYCICCTGT